MLEDFVRNTEEVVGRFTFLPHSLLKQKKRSSRWIALPINLFIISPPRKDIDRVRPPNVLGIRGEGQLI
jgi:hypothetical protein